jgi:sulfite reductase alpha subunit-like flavoprotein
MLADTVLEEALPKIRQRYYSIVNDPFFTNKLEQETNRIELCFTKHKFKDQDGLEQPGLCTSYLSNLAIGSEVKMQISKNTRVLRLPAGAAEGGKLVIICMGTGVVPFISMLKRIQNMKYENLQINMFYGVRSDSSELCYYRNFLVDFFASRSNSVLHLACSREVTGDLTGAKNVNVTKGYIQSVIS